MKDRTDNGNYACNNEYKEVKHVVKQSLSWASILRSMKACIFIIFAVQLLPACATIEPRESNTPPSHEWTASFPVIQPLPETEELQRKGDISIEAVPVSSRFIEEQRCLYHNLAFPILFTPSNVSRDTHDYFEEERYTVNVPIGGRPQDSLPLLVTITNHMDRVFRGSGTVVQFAVDGQIQDIERENYRQLTGAIIPPGSQQQIEIFGPPVSRFSIREGKITGLFFYDVITSTDDAGTPTERQNFEWFFSVELQEYTETVTGTQSNIYVTHEQARRINNPQAREEYRCFDF